MSVRRAPQGGGGQESQFNRTRNQRQAGGLPNSFMCDKTTQQQPAQMQDGSADVQQAQNHYLISLAHTAHRAFPNVNLWMVGYWRRAALILENLASYEGTSGIFFPYSRELATSLADTNHDFGLIVDAWRQAVKDLRDGTVPIPDVDVEGIIYRYLKSWEEMEREEAQEEHDKKREEEDKDEGDIR